MIRAIIIDDEKNCVESLLIKLNNFFKDINVIATANSAIEGIEKINTYNPDLVFLDIEMPGGNAFDLLTAFNEINFDIIFTTAYSNYAIKALKLTAIDYILKPIDTEELKEAITKYQNKVIEKKLNKHFKIFAENYKNPDSNKTKVVLPTMNGFNVVKLPDIIYCEADRNYTKFILKNSSQLVSTTIGQFEEQFSGMGFFRIHQSYLINLNHIEKYIKGSIPQVIMSNDVVLNISKNKKEEFKNIFFSYNKK